MAYKVKDIANKIVSKANSSSGKGDITSLELQKILYYMQGFYMVTFDKPMFTEHIRAWELGPVVPLVYDDWKHKKYAINYNGKVIKFETEEEEEFFNQIYSICSQYTAGELVDFTHAEEPWATTGKNRVIKKELIKNYFEKLIEDFELQEDIKACEKSLAKKDQVYYNWEDVKKELYN